MKKIYAALALMLTVATASAKYDVANSQCTTLNPELQSMKATVGMVENNNGMMKAAPSAQDLTNIYGYGFYSLSSSDGDEYIYESTQVEINGTEATIYGIFSIYPITGTFDPATGDITISSQDIVMNTNYNEMMKLYTQKLDVQNNQIKGFINLPSIVLHYCPNGVELNNGEIICVGGWTTESSFEVFTVSCDSFVNDGRGFMWHYMNTFPPMGELYPDAPMFKFVADEWKEAGTAKLTEGWFAPAYFENAPTYDVPVMYNVNKPTDILLVNPYDDNTPWKGVNTATNKDGYIYLNIEDPACVLVRPNVLCGFTSTKNFYDLSLGVTNVAGSYYYMDDTYETIQDVIDEFEVWDDPLSTLDNNTATLNLCKFQFSIDMGSMDSWSNGEDPVEMTSYVELPDEVLGGIEGMTVDGNNVKRFFNLQGIEVANPEAGQIVIVKEGSKTSKTIVR